MAVVVLGVGGTDGANVATGSPSNFTQVTPSGGTIKYDSDRTINGVLGVEVVSAAGANCICRYVDGSSSADMAVNMWLWGPGTTPGENVALFTARHSAGVNVRLNWSTTNTLIITPASGSTITIASGLNPAQAYQVKLLLHNGTSTTGTLTAKVYDSTGTQVGSTVTGSALNFGTAAFVGGDFGVPGSMTSPYVVGFVMPQMNVGGTSDIANYTPTTPASTVRPISVIDNSGGYTYGGGATDLATAAGDNNDTTTVIGPVAAGSGLDVTFGLPPLTLSSTGGSLKVSKLKLTGTGGTYTAALMQSTTVIKSWTLSPTATATDYTFTFGSTEATAIGTTQSDWNSLSIRIRSAA